MKPQDFCFIQLLLTEQWIVFQRNWSLQGKLLQLSCKLSTIKKKIKISLLLKVHLHTDSWELILNAVPQNSFIWCRLHAGPANRCDFWLPWRSITIKVVSSSLMSYVILESTRKSSQANKVLNHFITKKCYMGKPYWFLWVLLSTSDVLSLITQWLKV